MNEDTLNMDIRKFLKKVGINAQREIEHAVLHAVENGQFKGNESFAVTMTLDVPELAIHQQLVDTVNLEQP